MDKLFPDEHAIMSEAHHTMTPAQYNEYVRGYIVAGRDKIREASSEQIIRELRDSSSGFPELQAAIQNEALARIMKVCAL